MPSRVKKHDSAKGSKNIKKEPQYLTKRILASAARQGIVHAASETMQVIGHNLVVRKGWVVKKYADGRVERLSALKPLKGPRNIRLD